MEILLGIALIGILIIVAVRLQNRSAEQQRRDRRERDEAESRRLDECEDVVRYLANNYGYLARSVVSREDLRTMIASGMSAEDLRGRIASKMFSAQSLELGYQGSDDGVPVILPDELRDKHVYVIGKSGYGKTNFLRYMILQDMHAGHGIGVLAPEYELLTDELLPFVPEHRTGDVIYFNPADIECPVVLNPLHIDTGEDIDLHVDETFTILQRVVGEGGPRMDEILRHTLYALIERPGSTLLDIETLLDRQESKLRDEIIETTADDRTRRFFKQVYPQFPKESHLPITNRIGRIVGAKFARNCLCPPLHTTLTKEEVQHRLLNIRRAMDSGKILLFNLSDGILGEAASQLIGQLIVSKFQTATMSRANLAKGERRPFYLYLDEFQNFCGTASTSYEKILSRARKYRLGLILAHQQTGQLPPELLREIFGNVSTMVSFQVSQADASRLSHEFLTQYDYDVEPLPPEELVRLRVGDSYCRIGQSTFPMRVPLVDAEPNSERAKAVIERSRAQFGIPRLRKSEQIPPQQSASGSDPLAGIDPEGVFE